MGTETLNSELQVKPSQLAAILAKCITAKEPVLIAGAPGIGKSDIVEQAARLADAELLVSHPVTSDPTDYKGLPALDIANHCAHFLPFGDLNRLIHADRLTACFFDDLGHAPQAVQAALMQLALARRVNGHKVSDHVVFIGATNRRQDRAGVSGIIEPLKGRFMILHLAVDLIDFCTWAARSGIESEVIAYISLRPEALHKFEPTPDLINSPSPRGWARVSRYLKLGLTSDVQPQIFTGCVGQEHGVGFAAFLRIARSVVQPAEVFKNPKGAPIPNEPSALWALVSALARRVATDTMDAYIVYMNRLMDTGRHGEYVMASVKQMLAREPSLQSGTAYTAAMSGPLGKLMLGGN